MPLRQPAAPKPLSIRRRPARSAAVALLKSAGLPASDLTAAQLEHFFFSATEGSLTALVGLEVYGSNALLRSLIVSAKERQHGVGSALVSHAESYAAANHVQAIYLLTTTAEGFFRRFGYERIDRSDAPPLIQSTREFTRLCPATATLMIKRL
jgi:amino-acid N-acetyltransferase